MTDHRADHASSHEQRVFRAPGLAIKLLLAGAVVLVAAGLLTGRGDGVRRFWLAYVHNFAFVLSLSLGALFFIMLQYVTRSGWSVVVRRPAELMAANLVLLGVLFVPIVVNVAGGSGTIYPWAVSWSNLVRAGVCDAGASDGGAHASPAPGSQNPALKSERQKATQEEHKTDTQHATAGTGILSRTSLPRESFPARVGQGECPREGSLKRSFAEAEIPAEDECGKGFPHQRAHASTAPGSQNPALKNENQRARPVQDARGIEYGHDGEHDEANQSMLAKRVYLNPTFFIIRWVVYFAIWAGLGWWFWRGSLAQDGTEDPAATLRMQSASAPALLIYAITVTLAAFDLLMSLDPAWFSTIFGVYVFAGAVIGFFASMVLIVAGLQKRGYLTASVTAEHYHDLGKWLFGFVFFWGYIAFSQYMLIWYGNIPEETGWFFRRGCAMQAPNMWSYVIVLILAAHFIVPFVALLSREVKRRRHLLVFWAIWMLVMHWIDLYWLVMPELTTEHLPLGLAEIGCLVGLGTIYLGGLAWLAEGRSLVPTGDPRLSESLSFENI